MKKKKLTAKQSKAVIDAMAIITDDQFDRYTLLSLVNAMSNQLNIESLYQDVFRPHIKYDAEINGKPISERDNEVIQYLWEKCFEHFNLDDV